MRQSLCAAGCSPSNWIQDGDVGYMQRRLYCHDAALLLLRPLDVLFNLTQAVRRQL